MDKDKLPPIPTPVAQHWREFKIQVVPFVVFATVLVGIVYLWRTHVQPVGVIGSVETNSVNVTCLQDGVLTDLRVERFQTVTEGQEIGIISKTDPELIRAQIASAQSDLEVLRERLRVDQRRTDQQYQIMRQQLQSYLLDQAMEKAIVMLHSNDHVRAKKLFEEKQLPEDKYEAARAQFEKTVASIQAREQQIAEHEKMVKELAPKDRANEPDAIDNALLAKAKELQLMLEPSTLKAPISGMVSIVHHFPGERVLRGMPIISISDPTSRRIVGYVRQPVMEVPTTNDVVRIVTRSQPRQIARGQILRVGAQMETINPSLLAPDNKRIEIGLPILVSVPEGIRLLPGEHVNLFIEFAK
jgi:multidrug resistance efflux pump